MPCWPDYTIGGLAPLKRSKKKESAEGRKIGNDYYGREQALKKLLGKAMRWIDCVSDRCERLNRCRCGAVRLKEEISKVL